MTARILIADDEAVLRANVRDALREAGYQVDAVADGEAAAAKILEDDYAVVITDLRMPKLDGIGVLAKVTAARPQTLVLIMTAYASVETAIEALRLGAHDYLLKPVSLEDLTQRVARLLELRALRDEVVRLRRDLRERLGFAGIVGSSPAIRKMFELVQRVAPTDATVLITGDSGTGKELVARALHAQSKVADREFLALNMAALPRDTIEAQLFGHEKGAFTGADRRRDGVLRAVRGGTVFLDEVGEMPLSAQAKLLRAIEAHEILPVGADRAEKAEFRLLAATNRELEAEVRAGRFRQDLFFRLNVIRVQIPALRERRDDIPALVGHFVELHGRRLGRRRPVPSNEVMKRLMAYAWPGNVRELSNVIERACILCDGETLDLEHLPTELVESTAAPTGLKAAVEEFERRHIAWVLRAAEGNRERAAAMLEVDGATLYRRLAKYALHDGE
ncbi:MAG: sigma-54-dependent Fis family transcriptional regulator [Kofleriaceae bacterium]|jgi:two-component system response regulator HydG|nr:sigma-54-dependent Fis family transcriptional regulator [Kofleriaceae bacterium]MBP9168606.1 sigma-54-dependent Fis family transcriptional regulator [Kofleriaceae bacterium]MBP9857520.1 sigma-54-dependent Fis family transcriptional regulator [Kofleriaceae bacterium]